MPPGWVCLSLNAPKPGCSFVSHAPHAGCVLILVHLKQDVFFLYAPLGQGALFLLLMPQGLGGVLYVFYAPRQGVFHFFMPLWEGVQFLASYAPKAGVCFASYAPKAG